MPLTPIRKGLPSVGFTLVELLVVIAILALLAATLLPALSKAKESGRSVTCKNNLRQLALGMLMYADENGEYLPWPGDVDRANANPQYLPDWVFGGQPSQHTADPKMWRLPGYGHHAESGSIFTYVMSLPRVLPYTEQFTNSFPAYQCPSTGRIGRALRVNYSMNGWIDTSGQSAEERQSVARGIQTTRVVTPAQKILLLQEAPETMHNASFIPSGSANKNGFVTHNGQVNIGFVDGHVDHIPKNKMSEISNGPRNLSRLYFDPLHR